MEIQVSASKRTLTVVMLFCIAAVFVFGSIISVHFIKTKDYIPIQATVTEAGKYVKIYTGNKKNQHLKYVNYSYKVGNKEYACSMRTFFKTGKKEGNEKTIYVDRYHPEKVRDNFIFESGLLFLILFFVVGLFCAKAKSIAEE